MDRARSSKVGLVLWLIGILSIFVVGRTCGFSDSRFDNIHAD